MAGLAFFPTPYPDELWYSVLCRYHMRSGNGSALITKQQLYGASEGKISVYYTGHNVLALMPRLPDGLLSMDRLITEHTLFPFVSRFSSVEQRQAVYDYLSSGEGGEKISSTLRLWPYSSGTVRLRYCPVCNLESERKYGEYYWHVSHQIRTMPLCPFHYCRLLDSTAAVRNSCRIFAPASRYSCPQITPDYNCLPYEKTLTDTLCAYQTHPVNFESNPNFRDYLYNLLVNDGLLPLSSSKIVPEALREKIINTAGSSVYESHFSDSNFRNTIYLMLRENRFTVPNHFALLSTVLSLSPDCFLSDRPEHNTMIERFIEMSKAPYIFRKSYIKSALGLSKSSQLDNLAERLHIELFWKHYPTSSRYKKSEDSMKRNLTEIKGTFTTAEKELISQRIERLGIASQSEYIRYCVRLELAAVGQTLPKYIQHPQSERTESSHKPDSEERTALKPGNWNELMDRLRSGSIRVYKAIECSGLTKAAFYAFLREEPDADAIAAAIHSSRRVRYPDDWEEIVREYESSAISRNEAIRRSGFSAGTFYNRMKERRKSKQ